MFNIIKIWKHTDAENGTGFLLRYNVPVIWSVCQILIRWQLNRNKYGDIDCFQWTLWIELIEIYPGAQTSSRLGLFPAFGFAFQRAGFIQASGLILGLAGQIPTVWSGCPTLFSPSSETELCFPDCSSETAENYYDRPALSHISKQGMEVRSVPLNYKDWAWRAGDSLRRPEHHQQRRVDIGQPKTTDIIYSGTLISKISFSLDSMVCKFLSFSNTIDIKIFPLKTSYYF